MIIKYILPLIALSIVIGIHELGHLLAAKLFGVHVEVFSVGIGKKLVSFTKNRTQYALSLIPLGGYCKLKGGDIQNPIDDADSLDVIHPFKKIIVFFAGPLFNFILASSILTIVYVLPVHQILTPTILPIVNSNLPAETAGLQSGDKILSINNNRVVTFNDISKYIQSDEIIVEVERGETILEFTVYPSSADDKYFIGVYPFIPLVVKSSSIGSRLNQGDEITHINSNRVDNLLTLQNEIKTRNTFELTIIRDNNILHKTFNSKEIEQVSFINKYSYSPIESIKLGIINSVEMLKQISSLLFNLSKTGEVTKSLSSPIRLVYDIGNSITNTYSINSLLVTIQSFLMIIASVSLSLGFINLLPIPILDGGQILLNIITLVKGSPINRKFIYGYQTTGLIIVLLLFTLGITNDIFYFGDL